MAASVSVIASEFNEEASEAGVHPIFGVQIHFGAADRTFNHQDGVHYSSTVYSFSTEVIVK